MNNTQAGGLEAHRANALALRLEMGLPVTGTTSAAITYGGIQNVTWPILEGIARKAAEHRQPPGMFLTFSKLTSR